MKTYLNDILNFMKKHGHFNFIMLADYLKSPLFTPTHPESERKSALNWEQSFISPFSQPKKSNVWKDRGFVIQAKACWLERCSTNLCANINWWLNLLHPFPFISNLFWRLSNKLLLLLGVSLKVPRCSAKRTSWGNLWCSMGTIRRDAY